MAKKSSKKRRICSCFNEFWSFRIFFIVGGTEEEADKFAERKFGCEFVYRSSKTLPCWHARSYLPPDVKDCAIWFQRSPGGGLTAHESFHCARHVLRKAGVGEVSNETEEVYAYLTDWIVRQVGKRLW